MAIRFDDDELDTLLESHRVAFPPEPGLAERVREGARAGPPPSRWRLAWERWDARCETLAGSVAFVAAVLALSAVVGMTFGERAKRAWLADREGERDRLERRLETAYLARIDPLFRAQRGEESKR